MDNNTKEISIIQDFIGDALKMKSGETFPILYGVVLKCSNRSGHVRYESVPCMFVRRVDGFYGKGRYMFVYDFDFPQGCEMIKQICKDLNMLRVRRFFNGCSLIFNQAEMARVLIQLPLYLNKYSGDDSIFKKLSVDAKEMETMAYNESLDFRILYLEDKIKRIEDSVMSLDELRENLKELKKQKEELEWTHQ